jgi:hypothetical protein
MLRGLFAVAGLAALAWGAWLAWDSAPTHDSLQAAAWFVGGPLLHDGLVAPAVGIGGLVLMRFVPVAWRVPVAVGAVLSGVLALLAVPLLFRPFGVAANPGLHDGNYVLGLSVALGVVWVGVLVCGGYRQVSNKTNAARGRARG